MRRDSIALDRPFSWQDARRGKAAVMLAEDGLSDDQVAEAVGVSVPCIGRWKQHPEFKARIVEHARRLEAAMLRYEIAKRRKRVAALDDRWHRMQQVIHARAEEYADIPGGDTGLLVKQYKQIGSGPNATTVEEYGVDVALLKEMRETEKQAAQELKQWGERIEVSGPEGAPIEVHHVFDWDEYSTLYRQALGAEYRVVEGDRHPQPLDTAAAHATASRLLNAPES